MFVLGPLLHNTAALSGPGVTWTPSTPSTALAAWYDPTDITTLFKDTAGTVPVTADGDLVACMKDKSGLGNHAIQATGGLQPTYKAASGGVAAYLLFSGAQALATSAGITITDGSGQHSTGAAVVFTNNTGTQSVIDADNSGGGAFGGTATRVAQNLRNNAGTAETIAFNTAPAAFTDGGGSITATANTVLTELTSTTSTEAFIGGVGNGSTAVSGTMQSGTVNLVIGAYSLGAANFLTGKYFGSAHYKGLLSGGDHTSLVTYLTSKFAP